jgi:ABC-type multidrug transport system ATPase subunit
MDVADFETDARIGEWIDFLCACCGLDRESIFKTLLVCNFHERHLKNKVRDLAPEIFRQVYLAVCLASKKGNIIINDFIRGADKSFELKFNKLLLQKKAQGRAILYLGSDIFYASEIADRVGFIKDGRLLFEADAADLKEMDIKDLYLKFLN